MNTPGDFQPLNAAFALLVLTGLSACGSADADSGSAGSKVSSDAQGEEQGDLAALYDGGPILGGDATGAGGAGSGECISLMSWGSVGKYGAVPGEGGQDAVVSWLKEFSNATAEHLSEKQDITAELLAPIDVILIQNISDWQFTEEELFLFEDWVKSGGGVISLAGYSTDQDLAATNQLLSFSGLSYSLSGVGQTAASLSECSYCLGTTHRQAGWNADHEIALGILAVGAFQGREIHGTGQIVATEDGRALAVAQQMEDGRVFLFHDEWVSYTSQWSGEAVYSCEDNPQCAEESPQVSYQVPQFWFNTISWLAPNAECFAIDVPGLVR